MSLFLKFLIAVATIWVALVALFASLQTSIVFPRSLVGAAPDLPASTQRLTIERPDGVVLHGSLIPGGDDSKPLLLAFGGNAWNADSVALFLHQILPEHTIVAFHFRGYAPSTGRPSASAMMTDSEAIHDMLASEVGGDIISIGFSIGGGLAAHLAGTRPIAGSVLVTPFDSLGAIARQTLPWAPVRFLFRHEMDALSALSQGTAPVALILAARDEVIPTARSEALVTGLEDASRPAVDVQRIDAGHNDIYTHPDFASALRAAVSAVQD